MLIAKNKNSESIHLVLSIFLTVSLIYALTMTNAKAEELVKPHNIFELTLEELLKIEVSVASGNPQKQTLAPSSVSVFSRQEIQSMGISTVEQLLNFVPGFQSTRESVTGDGYKITARGQSNTQLTESILFLLDGKRMNAELAGGAMEFNHFISTANIERVEILRGANSALYGSGAHSGVVNIITVSELNEVQVAIGNIGQREINLNYSAAISEAKISLFARTFSDNGDNYDDAYYQSINQNFESINDARRGKDFYIKLGWNEQFQVNLHHVSVREQGFFSFPPESAFPDDRASQQENSIYARYELKTDRYFQLSLSGAYSDFQRSQNTSIRNTTGFYDKIVKISDREWIIDLESSLTVFDKHYLSAGAEIRRVIEASVNQFDNEAAPSGNVVFSHNRQNDLDKRQVLGLYIQDQYKISKDLELTAGIRYDDYSDFGEELSPRASLVYGSDYGSIFKLIYSKAYSAPNIRQLGSSIVGNVELKAEYVQSSELSWAHQFEKSLFSLTVFQANYENKITTIPRPITAPEGGPRIFANTGDVSAKGVELEYYASLSPRFTLRSALTIQHTEEDPHFVAEKTFSTIANYKNDNININLNAYYHGEMEQIGAIPGVGNRRVLLDDYFVLNGALRYTFGNNMEVFFRIQNLLNENYQSATRMLRVYEGLPNRGRNTSIGLTVTF